MLFQQATEQFYKKLYSADKSQKTITSYKKMLKALKKYLQNKYNGPVYVSDIIQNDLEDYLHHLKNKGLMPQSRAHAIYVMQSFFKYQHQSGVISINPAALLENIKIPETERIFLTGQEVMQLTGVIKQPSIKVMIIFLYYTGLRVSEATNLLISNIDLAENMIKIVAGKGNKDRVVPINDKLTSIIKDYLANIRPNVNSDRLFATKKTGKLSPQYINREIKLAVKELKWSKKVSAHTLRHSHASALIKNNVNIVHVSKLLGRSSLKTTSIYTHSSL